MKPPFFKFVLALFFWIILLFLLKPYFYRYLPYSLGEINFSMPGKDRSYYLVIPENVPKDERLPLFVFLMGFDEKLNPSVYTRENYGKVSALAKAQNFFAAFPRGMPGAFPDIPDVRAWYPLSFVGNQAFLASLTQHLTETFPIDPERVVLMGFSNGGYFAGIEMLVNPETPFKGFWLDGGAYPYAFDQRCGSLPLFLSYGGNDELNRPHIEKFRNFIIGKGWIEGANLETFMHNQGHAFTEEALQKGFKFFSKIFAEAKPHESEK